MFAWGWESPRSNQTNTQNTLTNILFLWCVAGSSRSGSCGIYIYIYILLWLLDLGSSCFVFGGYKTIVVLRVLLYDFMSVALGIHTTAGAINRVRWMVTLDGHGERTEEERAWLCRSIRASQFSNSFFFVSRNHPKVVLHTSHIYIYYIQLTNNEVQNYCLSIARHSHCSIYTHHHTIITSITHLRYYVDETTYHERQWSSSEWWYIHNNNNHRSLQKQQQQQRSRHGAQQ